MAWGVQAVLAEVMVLVQIMHLLALVGPPGDGEEISREVSVREREEIDIGRKGGKDGLRKPGEKSAMEGMMEIAEKEVTEVTGATGTGTIVEGNGAEAGVQVEGGNMIGKGTEIGERAKEDGDRRRNYRDRQRDREEIDGDVQLCSIMHTSWLWEEHEAHDDLAFSA